MLIISQHRLSVLAIAVCVALTACSSLQSDKIDYKTASKGTSLEVPPDLTQLSRDSRYQIPGSSSITTPVANSTGSAAPTSSAALLALGDVRVERSGNQRWLVVKRPPEAVWGSLRDFWKENGFQLTIEDQTLGILETDWAENRAKLSQDFIRNTLGKVLDQLFSTGERDRFRTRLERLPSGETEIYVSHRGLIEQVSSGFLGQGTTTVWVARDRDIELETEFLRRMMVRLGVSTEQSKAVMATSPQPRPALAVQTEAGQATLKVPESFDIAWRRVGLALDRTGFTVVDRDRVQGLYFVRYVPASADTKEPGFFAKLLGSGKKADPAKQYRIKVETSASQSVVKVLDDKGGAVVLDDAQRILNVIAQELR